MFSYSIVENALALNLGVDPKQRPAFAARLRHLRNLGIPQEKPGTGKRLSYSLADAQQMLFALLMQSIGCSPRRSVEAVLSLFHQHMDKPLPKMIAVLRDENPRPITAERLTMLLRNVPAMAVLNLDRASADLEQALAQMATR